MSLFTKKSTTVKKKSAKKRRDGYETVIVSKDGQILKDARILKVKK